MSLHGTLLFARYAYPPNELGFCGPDGAAAMLRPEAPVEIARRARAFEGAWTYLELIARANGIGDPLDERVVAAYWVGNSLLDRVTPGALLAWLTDRFRGQPGGTWRTAGDRATAHHSFQVFEVYPWAALLTAKAGPVAVSVLDRCRIRTGVVQGTAGETATVRTQPLIWDGNALVDGPEVDEVVKWSVDGRSLLPGLSPGDRVSLHWDWVCDVITDQQHTRLTTMERSRREALFPAVPAEPTAR